MEDDALDRSTDLSGSDGGRTLPDDAEPQVFAVARAGGRHAFTRRGFIEMVGASAASAATLAGCGDDGPFGGEAATATPPPSATPTAVPTPTASSTPTPECVVQPSSVNLRAGPGTNYDIVAVFRQGDALAVTGRTEDGTWFEVVAKDGRRGWMAASIVECSVATDAIPIQRDIPPSPTAPPPTRTPVPTDTPVPAGEEGNVPPGQTGIEYHVEGRTFHLPCGSPIPAGAVCVCNCVTAPAPSGCGCHGHRAPRVSSYWYPN